VASVALVNHLTRLKVLRRRPQALIKKPNLFLYGPTGCGKTLIATRLAQYLGLPVGTADANQMTAAGYIGEDVQSVIYSLVRNAREEIDAAQKGIVYIDEIDKIGKMSTAAHANVKDVGGEEVQRGLLRMIEGCEIKVPAKELTTGKHKGDIVIDTSNILFIVSGAFVALDGIVKKRMSSGGPRMGFNAVPESNSTSNWVEHVTGRDLMKFGMIPEFVGRFNMFTGVNQLTKEELIQILTGTKEPVVEQRKELLAELGVDIEFKADALEEIAGMAEQTGFGARALEEILNRTLLPINFWLPRGECQITADTVLRSCSVASIVEELERGQAPQPQAAA
jgi:ATP-dependent Clp protease ATP-binding subunit ClpX